MADEVKVERPETTDRECTTCGAVVAAWPGVMCCACGTMPWKLLAARPAPAEDAGQAVQFLVVDEDILDRAIERICETISLEFKGFWTAEDLVEDLPVLIREHLRAALAAMQPRGEQQAGREEGR